MTLQIQDAATKLAPNQFSSVLKMSFIKYNKIASSGSKILS